MIELTRDPAVTSVKLYRPADPILSPLTIRHVTFKNRVMSSSHACGLEVDGMPTEPYQLYHEEKAKGGIGLTMFGGSSNVAPDSPSVFRQLNVGVDRIIPHLQEFSQRIHRHGTKIMCQITHLGRRGDPYVGNWLPTIGPSPIRETLHRSFPKEMDLHDINRVVRAFGRAAERCKEGGLDGIEVMASSHLIGQFMSPRTNHRTDNFGGSLANRCRLGLMIVEEIRRKVGDDFLVGIRHSVEEGGVNGMQFDECIEAALLFEAAGNLDFFNAISGRMDTVLSLAVDNMPGMASPIAPWLARVGEFKRAVNLPVFHAARISDIATARHAIREGLLDLVGMTRAHIADPYIVAKLEAGQEETIRPCVGATHCQSQHRPSCLHNPASGRETVLSHIIAKSATPGKKIVIVGGGPAGLEAARISSERGHEVVLFEVGSRLGGQVVMASRASWRKDLIGLIDWRIAELERLNADVRLNVFAEEADITAEHPDAVIIATGGVPHIEWIDGAEHCTSVWDAITGNVPLAKEVILYDGTGRHPAPQFAEMAAAAGRKLTFLSIDSELGADLSYAESAIWKRRIHELDTKPIFDYQISKVERKNGRIVATFRHMYAMHELVVESDQIVVEHGTIPSDDLYKALRDRSTNQGVTDIEALLIGNPQPAASASEPDSFQLYRIGDAVSSRNVHTAMLDAHRLCMSL